MKKNILTITLFLISTRLFSQGTDDVTARRPVNSVYLNVLGDASMLSVNYERLFFNKPAFLLTGKIGTGFYREIPIWENQSTPPTYFTIPHHITGNIGKRQHLFEFGLGGTFLTGSADNIYILYPILGYRLLPFKSKKANFRIYAQIPFAGVNWETFWFVPIGVSFGTIF